MPHYLEELQGSLRLCTLSAGTDQVTVGDPVWPEALPWCSIASSSCKALCCHGPFPQALTKSHCRPTKPLQVIPSGRRPWCRIAATSCKALCSCVPLLIAGTDQVAVGDHVGQEALVQHYLQEFKGALLQHTLLAGANQSVVGDPVGQEALAQHCLQELQGSLRPCIRSAGTDQAL